MGIVFTRAWEDDRLDAELLAIGPGQRALVVAGAGDTALALAAGGGAVVAVDLNPDQLHLAALKLAAAQVLPPVRLHAWFESRRDPDVPSEYRQVVRDALPAMDRAWWDANLGLFDRGLHRSTGQARAILNLAAVARRLRPDLPRQVEAFVTPHEQAAWWRRHLRGLVFGRLSLWLMNARPLLALVVPDPNEAERVRRARWALGFASRVDAVLERVLVREHPWWRPLASGRPADVGHAAAWLDPDHVAGLATAAARIRWLNDDLTTALGAQPPASLDAISVSNVPDWLDEGAERGLADAVRRAVRPGARVLVRHLVAPTVSDPWLAAGLGRASGTVDLAARDRTALYAAVDLYTSPDQ